MEEGIRKDLDVDARGYADADDDAFQYEGTLEQRQVIFPVMLRTDCLIPAGEDQLGLK